MPINIRKDGIAKSIAINILGPPPGGLTDSLGNKKRYVKKDDRKDAEGLYQKRLEEEKLNTHKNVITRW